MTATLRRVVLLVASVNLAYFGIEFTVATAIGSVSLFADGFKSHFGKTAVARGP
jgi:Co/Zn/Cd efflux system component